MDILQFYQDYNIPYLTEGNKHCTLGWVNIHCPFCSGEQEWHLGFPLEGYVFRCWRCGIHHSDTVIAKLLGVSFTEAKAIAQIYAGKSITAPKRKVRAKAFKYPSNIVPLLDHHKAYLTKRKFDADFLEQEWNLMSTGPISTLDDTKYNHRIVAPIYHEGEVVTFQARDVTDKNKFKYMACPKDRELIHHKHIIYKHPDAPISDFGIVVEGITDVWRFGRLSVATFGIEYKREQARLIAKQFKRGVVIFDSESQAIRQARKLVADLRVRGSDFSMMIIEGDPGSMNQTEANELIKNLIR